MEENDFSNLKVNIKNSVDEHDKYGSWDGLVYNSTTILAVSLSSLAALLPIQELYVKILAGISALLITVDKALNWGERWIYHRQMRHDYLIVLNKIDFYENLPSIFTDEERKVYFLEIYSDLYNIRRKEASMPGVKAR